MTQTTKFRITYKAQPKIGDKLRDDYTKVYAELHELNSKLCKLALANSADPLLDEMRPRVQDLTVQSYMLQEEIKKLCIRCGNQSRLGWQTTIQPVRNRKRHITTYKYMCTDCDNYIAELPPPAVPTFVRHAVDLREFAIRSSQSLQVSFIGARFDANALNYIENTSATLMIFDANGAEICTTQTNLTPRELMTQWSYLAQIGESGFTGKEVCPSWGTFG